jgi:tetratricopeptide (TPR) repeat protein
LRDVPGLPAPTARQITDAEVVNDNALDIDSRITLIAKLRQAGTPELDRGEPSLCALASMIEDIDFAQVLRRLELDAHMYGIRTDETVEELGPLCAGHPYAAYLAKFRQNREEKEKGAAELVKRIDPSTLTFKERPMLQWLHNIAPSPSIVAWQQLATEHGDTVFGDLMRDIRGGFAGDPDDARNVAYMGRLSKVSDQLPAAVAQRVKRDWAHVGREAVALERAYADDPLVIKAFANRYYRLKRYDDAERCAKRLIEIHPGYPQMRLLANVYKAKNDNVRWKETLEKSLDLPARGLQQARVENDIAQDLLKRKEYKQAVVYADSAAESNSEWSLLTAARCHEMLGEWKKSEQLIRAATQQYSGSMMSWLKWCVRTNHGDKHAAEEFARSKYEAMGTSLRDTQYRNIGHFYLLTEEPEKALLLYQRAYEKGHDPFEGFHAAIVADTLGKTDVRDEVFQQILNAQPQHQGARPPAVAAGPNFFQQLAQQLGQMLPPKGAKQLNLPEVDKILAAASPGVHSPSVLPYFVGVFLKNRGDLKTAQIYLIRCAHSSDWQQINHVLAYQLLRKMKVTIPPEVDAKQAEPEKAAPPRSRPPRKGSINRSAA